MDIAFLEEDLKLLDELLTNEAAEIKVEIHHSRNREYKEFLKERERQITEMLAKVKGAIRGAMPV